MQVLNVPDHVTKAVEKKWARKLLQQVATWRTTSSPVLTRTDAGVPVERRPRRPRPTAFARSAS
jgi:hypothetical protein